MLKIKTSFFGKILSRLQKPSYAIATFAVVMLAVGLFVRSITLAETSPVGSLEVTYSSGSDYADVDIVGNTFDLVSGSGFFGTVKIDAEFGEGQEKKIMAKIPSGFVLLGYSATSTTEDIEGVDKIEIDNVYQGYVRTSTLTAATSNTHILDRNGNQLKFSAGTDWDKQSFSGYNKIKKNTNAKYYGHGGDIEWTFVDATTKVELVFTIAIDNYLLTHFSDTEMMDNIAIAMSSNAGNTSQVLKVNATRVQNSRLANKLGYPAETYYNVKWQDTIEGRSESFAYAPVTLTYDGVTGKATPLADELKIDFVYPENVYFDNKIEVDMLGITVEGEYDDGSHTKVEIIEGENGGGTITVTLTDVIYQHASNASDFSKVVPYFRADNTVYNRDNSTVTLGVNWSIKRNGQTKTGSNTFYRTLVFPGDGRDMTISPWNFTLRDYYGEYGITLPGVLGGFKFFSALAYSNVTMKFEFTDKMGVREVSYPGNNVRDVVAHTTLGRTVNIDSVPGEATITFGVLINEQMFGLQDNEFLLDVAATMDLPSQGEYDHAYTYGTCQYYGRFLNGETDTARLSIIQDDGTIENNVRTREPMTNTDKSTIGWVESAIGTANITVTNSAEEETTTFYPNNKITINGNINGGTSIKEGNIVVDPTIIISLPKGVNLDLSSVEGRSVLGSSKNQWQRLIEAKPSITQIIDGVEWKTYYYKSEDPLALVSRFRGSDNSLYTNKPVYVRFDAIVANSVPQYNLSLRDILSYDLGRSGVPATGGYDYSYVDTANRAGKGTEYVLAAGGGTIQIKPLIGLNVDIGIRNKGFAQDFMTYDGTENSIALLSHGNSAEVKVYYESTDTTAYKSGSVIYMPVAKKGLDYNKYFENMEVENPLEVTDNATFGYSSNLASIPTMIGNDGATWTTYFATNVTGSNSNAYTVSDGSWEPVEASGAINWVKASEYMGNLADVVMMKFVADTDILPGSRGACVYDIVLNDNVQRGLNAVNYWRTFYKAVTKDDNTGIWNYSSIIAANVDGIKLEGQLFIDRNKSASFENGDEKYTRGKYSVLLSRDDGTEPVRELVVDDEGHFTSRAKVLGVSYVDFMLKQGMYTLVVSRDESEERYIYSEIESDNESNSEMYYNDIKNINIDEEKVIARQQFEVVTGELAQAGYSKYLGIGLLDVEQPEPEPEPEPDVPVPDTGYGVVQEMSGVGRSAIVAVAIAAITMIVVVRFRIRAEKKKKFWA